MTPVARPFWAGWAAAVLAVVLFSCASVTSVVMQATEAAAAAAPSGCSMGMDGMAMPGMAMGHGSDGAPDSKGKASVCAYCSAAAQAPILSAAPPVRRPSAIGWLVQLAPKTRGERGPPAFRPRARAPPVVPQAA